MLVDNQISKAQRNGKINISPFTITQLNPNSYDVTLGNSFYPMDYSGTIDPRLDNDLGITFESDEITLPPQQHILGHTIETITLSNGYVAVLNGKSSWGRLGITIHQTAGFIDTGFSGSITLEIFNVNKNASVILRAGDRIGQLVFYKTKKSTVPYNEKLSSRYQCQTGVTPSRYWKGFRNESVSDLRNKGV